MNVDDEFTFTDSAMTDKIKSSFLTEDIDKIDRLQSGDTFMFDPVQA